MTKSGNNTEKALSFIGIWEQTIQELRTNDNGARFTTAESYEYSLKSFKKERLSFILFAIFKLQ